MQKCGQCLDEELDYAYKSCWKCWRERQLKIYCDNMWAVLFTKNNRRSGASRLMDIKYLKVQKMLEMMLFRLDTLALLIWWLIRGQKSCTSQALIGMFRELDYSHHSICFECGSKVLWFHLIQIHVINIMLFWFNLTLFSCKQKSAVFYESFPQLY